MHEVTAIVSLRASSTRLRHPRHATLSAMGAFTGRVHGSTIDLDAIPNAPFEGQRVRVVLELVDEDIRLSAEEQAGCWSAWIARGFDGPIEDEGEPEFP